jgi:hypothetical protein
LLQNNKIFLLSLSNIKMSEPSFKKNVGSRHEVWVGKAKKTSGGLFKKDLVVNKRTKRVVSLKASESATESNNLGDWLYPKNGQPCTPSPGKRKSPSPGKRKSPSPGKKKSPSPGKKTSPSPGKKTSPRRSERLRNKKG